MSKVFHGRQLLAVLMCLIICITLMPQTVWAGTNIDIDREASITLQYQDNGVGLSKVGFSVYKVADISPQAALTPSEDFAKYGIDFNVTEEQWMTLSQTIAGYIARDSIEPVQTGSTDTSGKVVFKQLTPGLYLVIGERTEYNGYVYEPAPVMASLPNRANGSDWTYDITSAAKFEKNPLPEGETVKREVSKVWEDKGGEKDRPKEVTVQLLADGKVYDTVTLNEGNDWFYSWDKLAADKKWQIVEKDVPENYKVTVSQEGISFIIVNRLDNVPPGTPDEPKLPQTGQLWWPVPMLALLGLVLFMAGLIMRSKAEKR